MFAGVLADRFDRRLTLVAADLSSAVIMLVLSTLVSVFEIKSIPIIYLDALALAALRPVYHPAFQGLIPQLTPRDRLSRVNAQVQSVDSILAFVGPVLGAGVIALLNPEPDTTRGDCRAGGPSRSFPPGWTSRLTSSGGTAEHSTTGTPAG